VTGAPEDPGKSAKNLAALRMLLMRHGLFKSQASKKYLPRALLLLSPFLLLILAGGLTAWHLGSRRAADITAQWRAWKGLLVRHFKNGYYTHLNQWSN
jgi:hypothetical protein